MHSFVLLMRSGHGRIDIPQALEGEGVKAENEIGKGLADFSCPDAECSICMERDEQNLEPEVADEFRGQSKVFRLNCKHEFHRTCLFSWFNYDSKNE